jgi:adenylate kinase
MYLVILGAPGAGKGTQAYRLSQALGLVHISSGELLRVAARSDTPLGSQVKNFVESGALVPDEIVIALILDRVANLDDAKGVILDGFPRNREQAASLDAALASAGRKIDKVLYVAVNENELVRRSAGRRACIKCEATYHVQDQPPKVDGVCDRCGGQLATRPDDTAERFRGRLRIYEERTAPLIDYYKAAGVLVEVNGEGPIDKVQEELVAALKGVA